MGYEKQNFENNKTVLTAEHLDHIEDGIVANEEAIKKKAEGKHTHKKEEITDFPTSMTPTAHTHKKEEITDFPSAMTPTAHSQGADTITAGTFAGQVVANSGGQAVGTSLLRNSKVGFAEETPTVNGEICWMCE